MKRLLKTALMLSLTAILSVPAFAKTMPTAKMDWGICPIKLQGKGVKPTITYQLEEYPVNSGTYSPAIYMKSTNPYIYAPLDFDFVYVNKTTVVLYTKAQSDGYIYGVQFSNINPSAKVFGKLPNAITRVDKAVPQGTCIGSLKGWAGVYAWRYDKDINKEYLPPQMFFEITNKDNNKVTKYYTVEK